MKRWEFTESLRTERLELRPMTADDAPSIHAWMSDPEVVRYQLYEPRSLEVVTEKVAEYSQALVLAEDGDYVQPAIVLDGEVVGAVYFKLASVENETAEIGWVLRKQWWGQGIAREAATRMLDLAFVDLGLHRVYAELDPRNDASVGLCLRLGMRREAHFVENLRFKGEWADTGVYAILAREWGRLPESA